jgi:hypothetical protein
VVDPPGGVGGLDGDGAPGVDHADVDALPGDGQGAAAADPPFHPWRVSGRLGWRTGGPSVAEAGQLRRGERVGQAAQQNTVLDELEQAVAEADGDPAAGEVVADRVLPSGQADGADRVDGAVHLDRRTRVAGCAGVAARRGGRRRPAAGVDVWW